MALRVPTPTRRLTAATTRIALRSPLSPSPVLQSHLFQARPSQPKPTIITTTPTTRRISTTAPRPWLLSALPNLTPGASINPGPPKTIRARRLLPYPPAQVYALIADIDSYTHFLPHCPHSRVTKWTDPAKNPPQTAATAGQARGTTTTTRHPARADLTVGWGPFTQTYTSRVYCVPGEAVEAVSGRADTGIPRAVLRSVGYDELDLEGGGGEEGRKEKEMDGGIFESLVTRWAVKPIANPQGAEAGEGGKGWTEVTLSVTFQFANPALGFAVGQLADEKVDEMIGAFEGRARQLYGR